MKYILFCIGDYKENCNEMAVKIANEIMPMVSSKTVKYYSNDLNLVLHFESDTHFEDLKVLIDTAITPYVGMYFLNTCTPKMSLGMSSDLYNHLFDLDDNETIPTDMKKVQVFYKEIEIDEEFLNSVKEIKDQILSDIAKIEKYEDCDECDNDLAQIMKNKKCDAPSLDDILDKISSSGIKSLTKEEKDLLDNYSK